MQLRREGYELIDDTSRMSFDTVFRRLHEEAYWSAGRERSVIERSWRNSSPYAILTEDGTTIGFARVVTDEATFAWIADVFIESTHRGLGLGTWMMGALVEHWRARGVPRLLLATRDAHEVYQKVGFAPLAHPNRFMEIDTRGKF